MWCLMVSVVGACTTVYRNHGYAPSDETLTKILIGIDTRSSVIETLGTPNTSGLGEGNSVYFISSRWGHYGITTPKPISREIVAIKFDASDVVENVSRYQLANGKVVVLSRRVTAGGATEVSFIRQLMGNFGRLDARDILSSP
jgi:outer membrane protein assembly factor BamE (lipoprotein component of BamABCDE complex)